MTDAKPLLALLCLTLAACTRQAPVEPAALTPPPRWQAAVPDAAVSARDWWRHFKDPALERLVQAARAGSHDLAAGRARLRQARAAVTQARAPLLPELKADLSANQQRLLRGPGFSQLDASREQPRYHSFGGLLNASYELDLWGGKAAALASAEQGYAASRFDQAALELTLESAVASAYLTLQALTEQQRIARQNRDNARQVLELVQTRHAAGAAGTVELAQQQGLLAAREREHARLRQQQQEARVALAALLGQPVQQLQVSDQGFERLANPALDPGLPSTLLARRPDIAAAEARLAAAEADIAVARAALLPSLSLTAALGSGADQFPDLLRNPYTNLGVALSAPIFNAGRLDAVHQQRQARQAELLATYQGAIVNAFADVERALLALEGSAHQQRWQAEERDRARQAFELAERRYRAGAETWLTVLETQRSLFQAEDAAVQVRLAQLQASVSLYKALGGGWQPPEG
ncbi:efflux transporter outer membrane subunit [Metapseudomonas otitidis]|uniref:efflux transporter outer membrane subunit n=1 Tax=Metapseudomonas otitidis TaxID=319939 RepID=UPI0032174A73